MLEKAPEDRISAKEALDMVRNFSGKDLDLITTDFEVIKNKRVDKFYSTIHKDLTSTPNSKDSRGSRMSQSNSFKNISKSGNLSNVSTKNSSKNTIINQNDKANRRKSLFREIKTES